MKPLIWIIDEEWPDYKIEEKIFHDAFPDYTLKFSKNDYEKDLEDFGYLADAVLCQVSVDFGGKAIEKLKSCKVISVYGSGYNNVDVDSAKKQGIPVAFVPGYCAEDIADYVMAAVLLCNKKLNRYSERIKEGLWGAQAEKDPPHRINASTMFILGFGRIGRTVALKAKALHMEVLACDPYVDEKVMAQFGVVKTDMETGLRKADYISVHTIYNPGTESLLSRREFLKMKKTAVVINASRGGVINQDDLVNAVKENTIGCAVLDVIQKEPPARDEPVLTCKNIIVTPHISYLSDDSLAELQERAATNVVKVLKGQSGADLVR